MHRQKQKLQRHQIGRMTAKGCAWQNLAADARKFTGADEMAGSASLVVYPSRGYSVLTWRDAHEN